MDYTYLCKWLLGKSMEWALSQLACKALVRPGGADSLQNQREV